MSVIYHITTKANWEAALPTGSYAAPSLQEEGFIHCSEIQQIPGVLERFYKGQHNLVRLAIDTEKLTSQLIYDWSPSVEDTFPHVYGPINTSAVFAVEEINNS